MAWKALLFSAKGRIGRRDFWSVWAVLAILGAVLKMFGLWGELLGLLLAVPQICLFSKRLHDIGRSGWWAGLIAALAVVGQLASEVAEATDAVRPDAKYHAVAAAIGGAAGVITLVCIVTAIGLFYRFAARRGDPGDNRYGPAPGVAVPEPQPAPAGGNA